MPASHYFGTLINLFTWGQLGILGRVVAIFPVLAKACCWPIRLLYSGELPDQRIEKMNVADNWNGWHPSRAAAQERLAKFLSKAGRHYAAQRNFDRGQARHDSVSTLSPWIRHRSITEKEVVSAVLNSHSRSAADKFIQEVFWRNYWKGWLEMRPQVWHRYRADLEALYNDSADIVDRCDTITRSGSGIECFDAWCTELINTGYLHNHARMWFASIWIYTLQLPWQLGADFFLRHLLDGDPASNTLSWRWVAGLHTTGKTYLARPDNIEKYTEGKYNPVGQLAATAQPLTEAPVGDKGELPVSATPSPSKTTALLVTEEDLCPDFILHAISSQNLKLSSVATLQATHFRSAGSVPGHIVGFVQQLIEDCVDHHLQCEVDLSVRSNQLDSNEVLVQQIVSWATDKNLQQIITAHVPVGPIAEILSELQIALAKENIALVTIVRDWDELVWPHASKGFFALKKKIPGLLDALCPTLASSDTSQLSLRFD